MNKGSQKRPQTRGEEIANSVSHGIGFLAALIATPFLIYSASRHSGVAVILGTVVFCVAVLLLYLASTLYHSMPQGSREKSAMAVFDHAAIFLLIAGTYTPFTLGVLQGHLGWTLFGIVWSLAVAGIFLKLKRGTGWQKPFSVGLYLCMGWLIVIAARPMLHSMPLPGIILLAAGGLAYSAGVPFYIASNKYFYHFVWHLFVLAGTACHFLAVFWYAV